MKKPIFIAHRGAPLPSRRENSLAAFERAAKTDRFEMIEFDVRRTRSDDDGLRVPIVAHDATTNKLYDLQRIPLNKRTYHGVELASLTYDMLRNDSLEVATLAEALRLLSGHKVNIEVKDVTALPEILQIIGDFIHQTSSKWKPEDFVITSFKWDVIVKSREMAPEIEVGLLFDLYNFPRIPINLIRKLNIDRVHIRHFLAPIFAPIFAVLGVKKRYAFTINNKYLVRFLQLFGVNGFFTDSISLPTKFD